jgi:hypothetical protein
VTTQAIDALQTTIYTADVDIGTLGQPFKLQIVCDASDTWVNVANSTFCQQNLAACQSSGICRVHILPAQNLPR